MEKAVKKTESSYLLHFNLAISYIKLNDLNNCEKHLLSAKDMNHNHASSHLLLSDVYNFKGSKVQLFLALHYFLFLEPNSKRSEKAYENLMKIIKGNITKEDGGNTVNINLSSSGDTEIGAAELMISMLEVTRTLEENEGKSDD